MNSSPVGLIGGTGKEGRGIGARLAAAGQDVVIGSRDAERAASAAAEINRLVGGERATGLSNSQLFSRCQILFLTVPFEHADATLDEHAQRFQPGQILVDVTVPLVFQKGPRLLELDAGSAAEHLRKQAPPQIPLVATFKTLPAALLQDLSRPLDCDEFVCHDSEAARDRVLEVLQRIPGVRWVDGGPLRYSRALEAMTMLVIGLNRRYRSHQGRFRVLGL